MVRLTTISNILSGLGIAVLGFGAVLWWIFDSLGVTAGAAEWFYPFYAWIGGTGILGLVILMSAINTFTEMTGFVHPEDKLVSNTFVFLYAIVDILVLGVLYPADAVLQRSLFDMASMIVIAYVFLFVFVFFSSTITEGSETGQVKEMTSRFMLVSLFLGMIMAGIKVGLDTVWVITNSYSWAAALLGLFAAVLVLLIIFYLGRKYEPVGE